MKRTLLKGGESRLCFMPMSPQVDIIMKTRCYNIFNFNSLSDDRLLYLRGRYGQALKLNQRIYQIYKQINYSNL
jgi:hypothetical protein